MDTYVLCVDADNKVSSNTSQVVHYSYYLFVVESTLNCVLLNCGQIVDKYARYYGKRTI